MNFKILLMLTVSIATPLIAGLTAFGLIETFNSGAGVLGLLFLILSFSASLMLVKTLRKLVALKTSEARSRYQGQNFKELKELFLARPYEAANFIEVKTPTPTLKRSVSA